MDTVEFARAHRRSLEALEALVNQIVRCRATLQAGRAVPARLAEAVLASAKAFAVEADALRAARR
jgi:hypothetical protein